MKEENIIYPLDRKDISIFTYKEIYEDKIYSKFFDVEDGDVVLDLGANLGFYSLFASEKNIKKVYMVEPMLENYDYMIRNVIHNRKEQLEKFIFIRSGIDKENGYNKIGGDPHSPHLYKGDEIVKTFTFMDFIDFYGIDKVDVMKIDIERSELHVFEDDETLNYIFNNINKICAEFHPLCENNIDVDGERFYRIIKKFEDAGYDIMLLSVDGIDIKNNIMNNNVLNGNKNSWDFYKQYMFYAKK